MSSPSSLPPMPHLLWQYGSHTQKTSHHSKPLPHPKQQAAAATPLKKHVSHFVMSFETPLPAYNSTDPTATFFSTSCIDLMLIELVPMAYRLTNTSNHAADTSAGNAATGGGLTASGEGVVAATVAGGGGTGEENTAERDAVFFRLDSLGYKVGVGLVERFSRDRPRFTDTLDVIKFLCKDIWNLCFKKQIDNLKTNHRGVYVLTDNSFRSLQRMSMEAGGPAAARASPFLWFPCGILRGALAAMDVEASVTADIPALPAAIFQITTTPPTAAAAVQSGATPKV